MVRQGSVVLVYRVSKMRAVLSVLARSLDITAWYSHVGVVAGALRDRLSIGRAYGGSRRLPTVVRERAVLVPTRST